MARRYRYPHDEAMGRRRAQWLRRRSPERASRSLVAIRVPEDLLHEGLVSALIVFSYWPIVDSM